MKKTVKQVIEMVEADGWVYNRTKGDHRIYVKEGAKRPIVIPGHEKDDMAPGTLGSILRTMKGG